MHKSRGRPTGRQPSSRHRPNHRNNNQNRDVDVSQVASAVKVQNFRTLLTEAGSEETLALALDMVEQRIQQLARGELFSQETAYHIELTLGVPGFLDQLNPQVTEALRKRLKTPYAQALAQQVIEDDPEIAAELENSEFGSIEDVSEALDVLAQVIDEKEPRDILNLKSKSDKEPSPELGGVNNESEITDMNKSHASQEENLKANPITPSIEVESYNSEPLKVGEDEAMSESNKQPDNRAVESEDAVSEVAVAPRRGRKGRARRMDIPPALQAIRQTNLALMTSQAGAKGALARLMDMSAANISHRLNGLKHLDDEEMGKISDQLGINAEWFDKPQTKDSIPVVALDNLAAARARRASSRHKAAKVPATTLQVPAERLAQTSLAKGLVESSRSEIKTSLADTTSGGSVPASPAPAPSQMPTPPPAAPQPEPQPQARPVEAQRAPVRNPVPLGDMGNLEETAPLAAALLHVLRLKISQGRVDEIRAAALLGELANL